jgi:ribosomal protein S18 acetylase RimI-like enzyme
MKFSTSHLNIIEKNHKEHFEFLPKLIGFNPLEENGVSLINCGLNSSMFNIAYGAPFKNSDFSIIKNAFNTQPFAWWIPPSGHSPELTKILLENNFTLETAEHAMICDLKSISPIAQKTKLTIKPVNDQTLLQHFIDVLEPYDPAAHIFYKMFKISDLLLNERLFVGYEDNRPATIAILFTHQNNCAIFSLITNEQDQGKGYGTDMMNYLLRTALENGNNYATLSASSDSGYRIYERLGFNKIGEFECFEWKGN